MWIKKQQLELNMEQWTGSKLGKEYSKAVYCHHVYLTYMHQGGVICISEVTDISPGNLISSSSFILPGILDNVLCIEVK